VIYVTIFASALALGACVLAALALHTSWTSVRELDSLRSTSANALRVLSAKQLQLGDSVTKLKQTAPTTLAAEVAELSVAVGKLAKTQQRFAGKFYAETRGNGGDAAQQDVDDELAAELALQNARPVAPGSWNVVDDRMAQRRIEVLARWWTSATQEERFALLLRSSKENTPPLREVQLAIYLAEAEAGEVGQG
jgi:hypothetical protein